MPRSEECGHDPLLKSLCEMWYASVDFSSRHKKDAEKIIKEIRKSIKDSGEEKLMKDVLNSLDEINEKMEEINDAYLKYHDQVKKVAQKIGYVPPSL